MNMRTETEQPQTAPLLTMRGISKRFAAVQALDNVELDVEPGEVHAIVGENGAGKSTLMHILCGVHQPDDGLIDFDGMANVRFDDEHAAQRLGIAIVYQERSLFPTLSIAENIFAGRQPAGRLSWIRHKEMLAAARLLLAETGLDADPRIVLDQLTPAHQQLVEIAKALSLQARLIIFDEPTAALTSAETNRLFGVIDKLKRGGTAIIYISHRLEEVFQISDRVTVLKDGRRQATIDISQTSPKLLISLMVGRELQLHNVRSETQNSHGPPVLQVSGLSDRASSGRSVGLYDVDLTVHRGEVVALAGLAGAGRTETALSIFGARPFATGTIQVDGESIRPRSVADAIRAGIGYLPEDRKDAGLFLEMSIAENIGAANLRLFGDWITSDRQMRSTAEDYRSGLGIACQSVEQTVLSLSGGNQQKALLAKWLLVQPKVLIVDEPTRGVDVGAKSEVQKRLCELARQGTAVLVISSDLPEVLAVADRIIVMAEGRVSGELLRADATEERIVQLASRVA
jgi:ABC-type sugar transport system ATPase subunit